MKTKTILLKKSEFTPKGWTLCFATMIRVCQEGKAMIPFDNGLIALSLFGPSDNVTAAVLHMLIYPDSPEDAHGKIEDEFAKVEALWSKFKTI